MKISRSRLKQIIQEEMGRIEEVDTDGDGAPAAPKWSKKPGKKAPKWADQDDNDPEVGDQLEEQVTPDNIMIAIDAIAKVLQNPGVAEAALGGILYLAMKQLEKWADKDAKLMADRPKVEVEPEEV